MWEPWVEAQFDQYIPCDDWKSDEGDVARVMMKWNAGSDTEEDDYDTASLWRKTESIGSRLLTELIGWKSSYYFYLSHHQLSHLLQNLKMNNKQIV